MWHGRAGDGQCRRVAPLQKRGQGQGSPPPPGGAAPRMLRRQAFELLIRRVCADPSSLPQRECTMLLDPEVPHPTTAGSKDDGGDCAIAPGQFFPPPRVASGRLLGDVSCRALVIAWAESC